MLKNCAKALFISASLLGDAQFPVATNHLMGGGYVTCFSARTHELGKVGMGYSHPSPYRIWNIFAQPFSALELTMNYRIFTGIIDSGIGATGFGELSDRGANFKWVPIFSEDNSYPSVAIGIEDFMGSKRFYNAFAVATQVFPKQNLEFSVGYSQGRAGTGVLGGCFAGCSFFPFWQKKNSLLERLGVVAEWDPVDYSDYTKEPHHLAREQRFPVNMGIEWGYKDLIHISCGSLRGNALTYSLNFSANFATLQEIVPKWRDPPHYYAPAYHQKIESSPDAQNWVQKIDQELKGQGFKLRCVEMEKGESGEPKKMTLRMHNQLFRESKKAESRLRALVTNLLPENIDTVDVVLEDHLIPLQSYRFASKDLIAATDDSSFSFLREGSSSLDTEKETLFSKQIPYSFAAYPLYETHIGSSRGKFKMGIGVGGSVEGDFAHLWHYEVATSYFLYSPANRLKDYDFYHPSQLLNVSTDINSYRRQTRELNCDRAFVQKIFLAPKENFLRFAGGYFQRNWGGVAAEWLYYPSKKPFAIGAECALLKKRNTHGLGFTSTIRSFSPNHEPIYHTHSLLGQYMLHLYGDLPEYQIDGKVSVGQFLAQDIGVRLETGRSFNNGIRLCGWITITNGNDQLHGRVYHNRGVGIRIPFDLITDKSTQKTLDYGASAWLRDSGVLCSTGLSLFPVLKKKAS